MTEDQSRLVVWQSLFLADYQVRYWERYQGFARRIAIPVKVVLGVAGALSLLGLILLEQYRLAASIMGTIAAVISTIILPALGWDGIEERLAGLRNEWIDVRAAYKSIWNELGAVDQAWLEKLYTVWNTRDVQLEQRTIGVPKIRRFTEDAYDETRDLLLR